MTYVRPDHSDSFADGSSTDLTVVLDALSTGLENVELNRFNVMSYGAVGDGVTNDTVAIQAAITAANAASTAYGTTRAGQAFVVLPPGKTFLVTPGAIVFTLAQLRGQGASVRVTSDSTGAALQFGDGSSTYSHTTQYLPTVYWNGTGYNASWTAGTVGVKIIGMYLSTFYVDKVAYFESGLWQTCASGATTSYNTFYLGDLYSNKVNLLIDSGSGANTGFTNESTYFGGTLHHGSTYGTNNTGCYNIKIAHAGTYPPDAHKFYGQALESDAIENYKTIVCEGGGNLFDWQRFESTYPGVYFDGINARRNLVRTSYALTVASSSTVYYASSNRIEQLAADPNPNIRNTDVDFRGNVVFANGVADQKADIYITPVSSGGMTGIVEVELVGGYSSANAQGVVRKQYSFTLSAAGTITAQVARVTEAHGATPDSFALSDVTWDAGNSRYRIQIVHRTSTGNTVAVRVRAVNCVATEPHLTTLMSVGLGAVYTTDATAFGRPYVTHLGSQVFGAAALATNATDGFIYIPTCAGTPTGVPTAQTGTVAMVFDTTNNKLYIYDGGWLGGTAPGTFS